MDNNSPPTEAELRDAFKAIDRATKHVQTLLDASGIPGARAHVHESYYDCSGLPRVTIRASKRLFVNHDGKRNLESSTVPYRNVIDLIRETVEHLNAGKKK